LIVSWQRAIARFAIGLGLGGIGLLGAARAAEAHGVSIDYHSQLAIELQATFDSGEPMANAQVTIYAPEDPARAWKTGTTDDSGQFVFIPDAEQSGQWTVSVRQAGHGDIVHIEINEASNVTSAASSATANADRVTVTQRVLAVASVVWGCIGTALYFSRKTS